MSALYRVYRPKRFSEVVGQRHIVRTLRNAVELDQVAHAYLFCGGRGLGKTTLARVLARALNCENLRREAEACLECRICKEMDGGAFLDLLEVDAASNTGVDNVRSLIESVRFQPTSGRWKVYIIDEAHMLSKGAWNALLKTLEEPPPRTVFVLATTEIAKVPTTINSRAQRFDFRKFSNDELTAQLIAVLKLEQKTVSDEVIREVVVAAQGGMRDALTLLDQVLALGGNPALADVQAVLGVTARTALVELLKLIHERDLQRLPAYFDELASVYFDAQAVVRDLLGVLRELLESRLARSQPDVAVAAALSWFSEKDLLFLIRQYLRAFKEVTQSPEQYLPFLIATVEAVQKFGDVTSAPASAAGAGIVTGAAFEASHSPAKSTKRQGPEETGKINNETNAPSSSVGVSQVRLQGEQVQEVWAAVCERIRAVNGPLGTLVRNSPILTIEGDTVVLGVKYLFHKEQIESTKNRQLIAATISESLSGVPVRVAAQFVLREDESEGPTEVIGDALRIFGGELVE